MPNGRGVEGSLPQVNGPLIFDLMTQEEQPKHANADLPIGILRLRFVPIRARNFAQEDIRLGDGIHLAGELH